MSTRETTPRHIWRHEVEVAAIRGGAPAEWLRERFEARMGIWFNAGESVAGAVEMILFTLKQEPREVRGEGETDFLRNTIRKAARS